MNYVIAYFKKDHLTEVILPLHQLEGLSGVSVSEIKGFGRGRSRDAAARMEEEPVDFIRRIRLEAFCPAVLVESVIDIIEKNAFTGHAGDGKIYVMPLQQAVRISTGERGEEAV